MVVRLQVREITKTAERGAGMAAALAVPQMNTEDGIDCI